MILYSPKERKKKPVSVKLYLLFTLGSLVIALLSYYTILNETNFRSYITYLKYFQEFTKNNPFYGWLFIAGMLLINFISIILAWLVEFLSVERGWITPPPTKQVQEEKIKNYTPKYNFAREKSNLEYERLEYEKALSEEYNSILQSPTLSLLAFLWVGLSRTARFFLTLPYNTYLGLAEFFAWDEEFIDNIYQFIINSWNLLLFFLNPLNLINESIDILVTLLVRVFFPSLINTLVLLVPFKINLVIKNPADLVSCLIVYTIFLIVIKGFSISYSLYIRNIRNSRYNIEQ